MSRATLICLLNGLIQYSHDFLSRTLTVANSLVSSYECYVEFRLTFHVQR